MSKWMGVTFACAALWVSADATAGKIPPVPDNPMQAQTSLGFNTRKSCPDLRISDEGNVAVVVFWLTGGGIPAQLSIKTSSGSSALDAAALSCATRLRFAPATRLGDGETIDSWQQVGFRWVETRGAAAAASQGVETGQAVGTTQAAGMSQAAEQASGAPARVVSDAKQRDSGAQANSVTVHVCADESGKLKQDPTIVRSSGNASVDQAAVHIAASGSPYYRPGNASSGSAVSGCAQLVIQFETK